MKKNLNLEIGERIRQEREFLGYTREQFSEILDISERFLADIELGNRGMSFSTLINISQKLNVTTDYILIGTVNEIPKLYKNAYPVDLDRKEFSILIGNKIREIRTDRGISQEDLALEADIHPDFYGKMERGERCPSIYTIYKLCKSLEMTLSEILDIGDEISPENKGIMRIIRLISRMDVRSINLLFDIITKLSFIKFR